MSNNLNDVDLNAFMGSIPDLPGSTATNNTEIAKLQELISTLEKLNKVSEASGINKWFVPGTPFGIENCPKHKAFFDAGAVYNERMFMAGNRCGKSIAGAYEASCHATGIYPEWWRGKRFDKPTAG